MEVNKVNELLKNLRKDNIKKRLDMKAPTQMGEGLRTLKETKPSWKMKLTQKLATFDVEKSTADPCTFIQKTDKELSYM
ncbi:unnamed protein product [Hermetia illucens]|uniref:Uncharacterized protein n=1 Tax=Hermetia illucens TaxID=343691 RepID=A0A7R8UP68_HERIL|nr:unnamed protein product [Hermetia illucens]